MKTKYFLLSLLIPFLGQSAQKLYVSHRDFISGVTIIDTATNAEVGSISTALTSFDIAFLPNGEKAYVTGFEGYNIINVSDEITFKTTNVGNADGLAVHPNGTKYYVCSGSDLVVFDAFLDVEIDRISVGVFLIDVAVTPDGSLAYVVGQGSSVSAINTATNTVIATLLLPDPRSLAITPDGSAVYVVNQAAQSVSVIDTATNMLVTTISVPGANAREIAIAPDGLLAYVVHLADLVSVIDIPTNMPATTFSIGATTLEDIVITPDGTTAYIADNSFDPNSNVFVIDLATNSVTQTIPVSFAWLALTPPSSQVSGERKANISLGQREFSNIVTWTTPTDITTTGYLIFRDSALTDLAAEISDPNILKFEEHNLSGDEAFTYQVVALDQYNNRYPVGSGVFLNFK